MQKTTFWELVRVLGPLYPEKLKRGDSPVVDLPKAVAMTLRYLGRRNAMFDIGDIFGVAESTVHAEVHRIVNLLCDLAPKFIVWPSEAEAAIVRDQFKAIAGYPGVIGAIDGCHISVIAPAADQDSYIDRKCHHSIILQGICTAKKFFTNVSIGVPGSRNDNRALSFSAFHEKLMQEGPNSQFYNDFNHLIGDKAYPCRTWLMSPYKDYGNLTRLQRNHNYIHSSTRAVVEHIFGLLKGRWRCLLGLILKDIAKCSNFVLACCVLHNFCYLNNDHVIEAMEIDDRQYPINFVDYQDKVSKRLGKAKRDNIASTL